MNAGSHQDNENRTEAAAGAAAVLVLGVRGCFTHIVAIGTL